jgi:hypothetical protein
MNDLALRAHILAEWAKGKFASEIAVELGIGVGRVDSIVKHSHGPEAAKARAEHYRNKALREPKICKSQESLDREARVLAMWADGWSAADIAIRFGGEMTRNIPIGIVNRSRGEVAERAKREHAAAAALRYPKGAPRQKRAAQEPAQRNGVVSGQAPAERRAEQRKAILSPQALAEHREKRAAIGRAAIAKLELTLIDNPGFVAKVEKPGDLYGHMSSEKGYFDAIAALSR